MRKNLRLILISLTLLVCSGCQATVANPYTGTQYNGSIDQEGFGVKIKLPFWEYAFDAFNLFKEDEDKIEAPENSNEESEGVVTPRSPSYVGEGFEDFSKGIPVIKGVN